MADWYSGVAQEGSTDAVDEQVLFVVFAGVFYLTPIFMFLYILYRNQYVCRWPWFIEPCPS